MGERSWLALGLSGAVDHWIVGACLPHPREWSREAAAAAL